MSRKKKIKQLVNLSCTDFCRGSGRAVDDVRSVNRSHVVKGINCAIWDAVRLFVLFGRSFSFRLFSVTRTIASARLSTRECVYLITDVYIVIYFIGNLSLLLYMWNLYYVYRILCWIFIG